MSDTGYIRLYRSLLGHPAFRNDGEAMVFAWMVLRASWRPSRVRYKGRPIELDRGQLAMSVRDLAEHHDRPKGWIERLLKRLRDETMCETHSETGVLVITICNYNEYQAEIETSETVGETPTGQTQDSGRTQNKEGNKGKKESPLKPPRGQGKTCLPEDWSAPAIAELPPQARQCAGQWPSGAYARHAEAFHSYWRSNGKKMTDWRLTWANRVIAIHDQVMRNRQMTARYGSPEPGSTNPMIQQILSERQHQ